MLRFICLPVMLLPVSCRRRGPALDALDANADGRLTRDEVKGSPLFKIFRRDRY